MYCSEALPVSITTALPPDQVKPSDGIRGARRPHGPCAASCAGQTARRPLNAAHVAPPYQLERGRQPAVCLIRTTCRRSRTQAGTQGPPPPEGAGDRQTGGEFANRAGRTRGILEGNAPGSDVGTRCRDSCSDLGPFATNANTDTDPHPNASEPSSLGSLSAPACPSARGRVSDG
ncbi:hypothetical protein BD309DRAFT_293737 [Dichomitus squalens]|nr:hypothetical protein BD309DRAFT_293737 [Dichomitus squalens]